MKPRSLLARAQLGAARATQQAAEALRRAATASDAREGASAVLEAASHGLGACARLAAYHAIAVVTGERVDVAPPPPTGVVEFGERIGARDESVMAQARRRIDEEARRDPKVARGLAAAGIVTEARRERARRLSAVEAKLAQMKAEDARRPPARALVGVDGQRWACEHADCPPRDGSRACASCPRRPS